MTKQNSSRRKFLKLLGLSTTASIVSTNTFLANNPDSEIKKLNPEQQEFMIRYEKWMDEFLDVIRIKKEKPYDVENNKKMDLLTKKVEKMKPELTTFLKDETFAIIYMASIKRVKDEIKI